MILFWFITYFRKESTGRKKLPEHFYLLVESVQYFWYVEGNLL